MLVVEISNARGNGVSRFIVDVSVSDARRLVTAFALFAFAA